MMHHSLGLLCLLLLALVPYGCAQPATAHYYNAPVQGYSSQYDTWSSGGGCGFINNPGSGYANSDFAYTTAIGDFNGAENFYDGEVCGMCVKVLSVTPDTVTTNPFPSTPFIMLVNNHGPVNRANWLDIYNANPVGGNWVLQWQAVPCPGLENQPVQWQVNSGSHEYYVQLIPVYSKLNIVQMCIYAGGSWTLMDRVGGGNGLWFYNSGGAGTGPIASPRIRAFSVDGQVIEDTIDIVLSGTLGTSAIYGGGTPSQFADIQGQITGGTPGCNTPPTNGTAVPVNPSTTGSGSTTSPSDGDGDGDGNGTAGSSSPSSVVRPFWIQH